MGARLCAGADAVTSSKPLHWRVVVVLRVTRSRYVENAAFQKDVVILLDRSGSMKGVRLEIARSTVKKILSTLTDDDYFNVITVRCVLRAR